MYSVATITICAANLTTLKLCAAGLIIGGQWLQCSVAICEFNNHYFIHKKIQSYCQT